MNKYIKINCPSCNENIVIEIDDSFELVSITIDNKLITSEEEINQIIKKHNIEFG
jgi:uncharacterized protein YuzE